MNPTHTDLQPIDRPPRIQPPLPVGEIEIPAPPDKQRRTQSLLQLLLPLLTIVGYVLVSAGGGGRNILFVLPMGLTVIISSTLSYYSFHREQQRIKELEAAYTRRLLLLRKEMLAAQDSQRLFFLESHPDTETIWRIGSEEEATRIGSRLWHRRPEDWDFGAVRLGTGDVQSYYRYVFSPAALNQEDPQADQANQLAEESRVVPQSPLIVYLRPHPPLIEKSGQTELLPGTHSIGIAGSNQATIDFTRSLLVQFIAFHSPRDTSLFVIGAPHAETRWQWVQWLPHTNSRLQSYEGDRLCFAKPLTLEEEEDARVARRERRNPSQFWRIINKELANRRQRLEDESAVNVALPLMLIVIDNLPSDRQPEPRARWLDDITSEAAVSAILENGQKLGAAILFLAPATTKIPGDCQAVIKVDLIGAELRMAYQEVGVNSPTYLGSTRATNTTDANTFAQSIKDCTVRMGYGADLQNSVSILDIYKTRRVEDLPVRERWQNSRNPESADWLRVPIGVMSGGGVREIYFQQDHDGVHGMIAGTTGSGKSELLLTLIAGLAINYDPTILNFVLVDYKAGAAFEPFRHLPHCVDILTNLEGNAVERMFIAIKAELDRRGALLAKYNVKEVVQYRQRGYHKEQPLPHLFIIVDEFAEMVSENSEYKSRFENITRLGRALGVSLLLATQRPSGAVSDQMRANIKLRICLRVETSDDSRELLGRSDANFLPSGIPGRAYVQIGRDAPNLIQVARAGGDYVIGEEAESEEIVYVQQEAVILSDSNDDLVFATENTVDKTIIYESIDALGEIILDSEVFTRFDLPIPEALRETDDRQTIVDHIVKLTQFVVNEQGTKPQRKPWPDALPPYLPLNQSLDASFLEPKPPH